MKWSDTIASSARYGEHAGELFKDGEVLWECSNADYQGSCAVLVAFDKDRFAFFEWSYGSCSGCDGWEDAGLDDEQIVAEMRRGTAYMDAATTRAFLDNREARGVTEAFSSYVARQ